MKKLISAVLAGVLALSLAACGSTPPASEPASGSTATSASTPASASAAAESKQYIFSVDDLTGKNIGVQLGTTGDIYAQDVEGATVEQYNKFNDAVLALKQGKVDAVIIDNEPGKVFVEQNDDITMLDEDFAVEDYAIALNKGSELTAQFNEAIAAIQENGTLDAILDKYINGVEGAEGYVTPEGTEYPNGTLTMATNAYFPPYEYYEGDEIVGIDAEFAKAICDYLGYELVIEDMEFASIIPAINSGKADFGAAGMTVTEERLVNVDFTNSYCTGIQSVLVLK
ncbi:transporter substrate-binding domain-containing protein [Candidatus Allofournierella excrementigallinarum]|uniref:transporter substrate-binding domain-containing protein n=1 Tax=Candidatus Allofournierella excrementigallinarum TaxID=2838592 RepID=UPI00374EDA7D